MQNKVSGIPVMAVTNMKSARDEDFAAGIEEIQCPKLLGCPFKSTNHPKSRLVFFVFLKKIRVNQF